MSYINSYEPITLVEGALVFKVITNQLLEVYKLVKELVNTMNLNIEKMQIINISYLYTFYGVTEGGMQILKSIFLKKNYNTKLIESINEILAKETISGNASIKKFKGHQESLGHYFRNLYNIVQIADMNPSLSYKQKYNYVKLLRTQLNQFELFIFFINSLSELGSEWEKKSWITSYKLIKNLPIDFGGDINPKEYYPKIDFERE